MSEPVVSERFDIDDIQKIREYNSLRHIQMTPEEIIADTKKGAERIKKMLKERKCIKA